MKGNIVVKITIILLAMMGLWISEIDAQVSVSTFTGDADCEISASKVYTHALNVGGPAITINSVPFLGALEEDLESPRGWSDFPPTPRNGNADGLSGSIAAMLSSFQYGMAEFSFTLTGMKPKQAYVVRFWQRAWERGFNRRQTFSFSTDGGESWTEPYLFNPDEVSKGASLNFAYIAEASAEVMMRVVAENPNGTLHLYGVSNEETTPDAVKAVPKRAEPKDQDMTCPDLEASFVLPPDEAKPGVWWHWMGCNVSAKGITRDLEEFKSAGISSATIFGMADSCTPWAAHIGNSPTEGLLAFTDPWWKLVRHAAAEGKRLGIDVGLHNCPGYTSTGGPWITPELSMQQIFQSATVMDGGKPFDGLLPRPGINPQGDMLFPMVNKQTGVCEKPLIPARTNYWRDIAVLAVPAEGVIPKDKIIDVTKMMTPEGRLRWTVPQGKWMVYRFGHTTMGALTQPNQWEIMGLECDKMSEKAVRFHLDHVIGDLKKHLGSLVGSGLKHILLDSYEAGTPSWTPLMPEEFAQRRGYELNAFLPTFAKRVVENDAATQRFKADFSRTIADLYRDKLFATMAKMLEEEKLRFVCEPYGGPFSTGEVAPYVHRVMTEFWAGAAFGGAVMDGMMNGIFNAGKGRRHNILEAEAFTGAPSNSQWTETPAWLKPVGDGAFCAGINRLILHTNPHQPWDDRYKPGMTMGQWGTHFGRTQTWWEPGKAWLAYLARCQAVLQWGRPAERSSFLAKTSAPDMDIRSQHRSDGKTHAFFIANVGKGKGVIACRFNVGKLQPELWNPVTGEMRSLNDYQVAGRQIRLELDVAPKQSWFVIFRKTVDSLKPETATLLKKNIPEYTARQELVGPWTVQFDPKWGGPVETLSNGARATEGKPVIFETLEDWTQRPEKGIKFYSGTAVYRKSFDVEQKSTQQLAASSEAPLYLDLGTVHHLARVRLNGRDLGVVWCAPWGVSLPKGLLKAQKNLLEIEVTNVWANRLIGDEQEPTDCEWKNGYMGGRYLSRFPDWFVKGEKRGSPDRYTFCTWNYFNGDSKLVPSGLLGPVRLMCEK